MKVKIRYKDVMYIERNDVISIIHTESKIIIVSMDDFRSHTFDLRAFPEGLQIEVKH